MTDLKLLEECFIRGLEVSKWKARFEWLAMQHWIEPETTFRLDLANQGDDLAGYLEQLIAAIDVRRGLDSAPLL
jgi:hypothetical protein